MRLLSFLPLLAGAIIAAALPNHPFNNKTLARSGHTDPLDPVRHSHVCGAHIDPERRDEAERIFKSFNIPPQLFHDDDADPTPIETYWVNIYANKTYEGGYLTHEMITEQMRVLNEDYTNVTVFFEHKKTIRVHAPRWFEEFEPGSEIETKAKKRYRRGGPERLYIYTASLASTGLLGWAYFPSDYSAQPELDGVVLNYASLPGGSLEPFNAGKTLTHEAGHWAGLYHTFEGGCEGAGDEVNDTPAEAEAAFGCQRGRDSCPNSEGLDPIENFMDYSDDVCMLYFTNDQVDRIKNQLRAFRNIDC